MKEARNYAPADDLGTFHTGSLGIARLKPEFRQGRIVCNRDNRVSNPLPYPSGKDRIALLNQVSFACMADCLMGKDTGELRIEHGIHGSAFGWQGREKRYGSVSGTFPEFLLVADVEPPDRMAAFISHLEGTVS
jgi:hypothetical protein